MNKHNNALNTIFAIPEVSAKFAEVTNREVINQHVRAQYGNKLSKLTGVTDEDYARMLQAIKEHFFRAASEYCRLHPDTNMITAIMFVMNQAEANKVAERFVLGSAPVKGVKALFSGAKNLATRAYETAFPERSFEEDMKEFKEDLKESGHEVKEELGKVVEDAKGAFNDFKAKHAAPASEEENSEEEASAEEHPVEEAPAENTQAEKPEEQKEKMPRQVSVIVMEVAETGEIPDVPEDVMKNLPPHVQEFLKDLMKNGGKNESSEE